jgi:hypothetical protein
MSEYRFQEGDHVRIKLSGDLAAQYNVEVGNGFFPDEPFSLGWLPEMWPLCGHDFVLQEKDKDGEDDDYAWWVYDNRYSLDEDWLEPFEEPVDINIGDLL